MTWLQKLGCAPSLQAFALGARPRQRGTAQTGQRRRMPPDNIRLIQQQQARMQLRKSRRGCESRGAAQAHAHAPWAGGRRDLRCAPSLTRCPFWLARQPCRALSAGPRFQTATDELASTAWQGLCDCGGGAAACQSAALRWALTTGISRPSRDLALQPPTAKPTSGAPWSDWQWGGYCVKLAGAVGGRRRVVPQGRSQRGPQIPPPAGRSCCGPCWQGALPSCCCSTACSGETLIAQVEWACDTCTHQTGPHLRCRQRRMRSRMYRGGRSSGNRQSRGKARGSTKSINRWGRQAGLAPVSTAN